MIDELTTNNELKTNQQVIADLIEELDHRQAAIDEAANKVLLYAGKYSDIVQSITDPENQPSQYGTVTLAYHWAAIDELMGLLSDAYKHHMTTSMPQAIERFGSINNYRAFGLKTWFVTVPEAIAKHTQRKEPS